MTSERQIADNSKRATDKNRFHPGNVRIQFLVHMTSEQYRLRRTVLDSFQEPPDFTGLTALEPGYLDEAAPLLRWLDESGLALYLAHQLSQHKQRVAPILQTAIEQRIEGNRIRTASMLAEFRRISGALQRTKAKYVVVKGLTVANEFCPDPRLRHQCDLDLLVTPESANVVRRELVSLGYRVESVEVSGEICMAIRSEHIPSSNDDLYSTPKHWHVEIHSAFFEKVYGTSLNVGEDWGENIEWRELEGCRYPSLTLEYRFLLQVLHVFRHIASWIRLSWLCEIAYFVRKFRGEADLWDKVCRLTAHDVKVQNACGIASRMVAQTFGTHFPDIIEKNWIGSLQTRRHHQWVERYGALWVLNDFTRAEKSGFLLQRDFADSNWSWWYYRAGCYIKFFKKLIWRRRNSGPLMLRERVRRQLNYMLESAHWSIEGYAANEAQKNPEKQGS